MKNNLSTSEPSEPDALQPSLARMMRRNSYQALLLIPLLVVLLHLCGVCRTIQCCVIWATAYWALSLVLEIHFFRVLRLNKEQSPNWGKIVCLGIYLSALVLTPAIALALGKMLAPGLFAVNAFVYCLVIVIAHASDFATRRIAAKVFKAK